MNQMTRTLNPENDSGMTQMTQLMEMNFPE